MIYKIGQSHTKAPYRCPVCNMRLVYYGFNGGMNLPKGKHLAKYILCHKPSHFEYTCQAHIDIVQLGHELMGCPKPGKIDSMEVYEVPNDE